jgi:multidrug resistance efflux pump
MDTNNTIIEQEEETQKQKNKRRRNIILNTISALLALSGIIWGIGFFLRYYKYEITNDATIEQYIMPVNARVSGYIKEVRFTEHTPVNEGDTLLIIDNQEFTIKLMDAEANYLMDKTTGAALEMAKLNLSYTVITAPYSGYVGRRTIEEGQLVQAGQTITNLIKNDKKWIIANYREKQIAHIYIGQPVRIRVDALNDKVFTGHVTAISEVTGSKFSMLPTDNSAGNFVKIQQRIPVRIDFDDISDKDRQTLRAGMMVITEAIKR